MKNRFLVFLVLISRSTNPNMVEENSITIIVSNPKEIRTNLGTGIDIKSFENLDYITFKKRDTIKIPVNNYRKIYLRNDDIFKSIICQNRDTVLIDISEEKVNIHFLNRVFKKYDTLSLSEINKLKFRKELNLVQSYKQKLFSKESFDYKGSMNKESLIYDIETYKEYYALEKKLSLKKKQLLQKIFNEGLINKANYEYNLSRINYQEFEAAIRVFKKTKAVFFKDKILKKYFKSEIILNDDFIAYGYINRLITDIILEGKPIQTLPSLKYDYKAAFDSLPKLVSSNILKYSQFLCLSQIAENNSYKEFEVYEKKYLNHEKNRDMIQKLESLKINFANPLLENLETVQLISIDKKSLNLHQVLEEHQGKVIYIDFWASWCAPCRDLMPLSKSLMNEYKSEPIVFVYLSIDNAFEKWKKASDEDRLSLITENYLAVNYPVDSFYKTLSINSIPRYLLISKKGELVYEDAPSPNSEELRTLFIKYLNE